MTDDDESDRYELFPIYPNGIRGAMGTQLLAWRTFAHKCSRPDEECPGHVVVSCTTSAGTDVQLVLTPRAARELRAALAPAIHDVEDTDTEWIEEGPTKGALKGKYPFETYPDDCRVEMIVRG